jgi:hypothetical protein
MFDGSWQMSVCVSPSVIPSKSLRYKGKIHAMMRKIGGLNCPEGEIDGHPLANHEEEYTEKFLYTQ